MIYYQLLVKSNIKSRLVFQEYFYKFLIQLSKFMISQLTHDVQPLGAGLHLALDIEGLAGVVPGIFLFHFL